MFAGTALYIRLLVYAGLSLFIINGLYVFMVVCVVYAYNLTDCLCTYKFPLIYVFIFFSFRDFKEKVLPCLADHLHHCVDNCHLPRVLTSLLSSVIEECSKEEPKTFPGPGNDLSGSLLIGFSNE